MQPIENRSPEANDGGAGARALVEQLSQSKHSEFFKMSKGARRLFLHLKRIGITDERIRNETKTSTTLAEFVQHGAHGVEIIDAAALRKKPITGREALRLAAHSAGLPDLGEIHSTGGDAIVKKLEKKSLPKARTLPLHQRSELSLIGQNWVTTTDAAAALGISRQTIFRWGDSVELPMGKGKGFRSYKIEKRKRGKKTLVNLKMLREIANRKSMLRQGNSKIQKAEGRNSRLALAALKKIDQITDAEVLREVRERLNRQIFRKKGNV
jgi:hypothetical protein